MPAANLVGAENEGWKLITSQLNHERVGLAAVGALSFQLYEEVLAWAADTPAADGPRQRYWTRGGCRWIWPDATPN